MVQLYMLNLYWVPDIKNLYGIMLLLRLTPFCGFSFRAEQPWHLAMARTHQAHLLWSVSSLNLPSSFPLHGSHFLFPPLRLFFLPCFETLGLTFKNQIIPILTQFPIHNPSTTSFTSNFVWIWLIYQKCMSHKGPFWYILRAEHCAQQTAS